MSQLTIKFLCILFAVTVLFYNCARVQQNLETSSSTSDKGMVKLQWEFQPRADIYGFDIYRADREEGPFAKVTKNPVLSIDPRSGKQPKYEYIDKGLLINGVYYYSIEAINTVTKKNERISPILRLNALSKKQLSQNTSG